MRYGFIAMLVLAGLGSVWFVNRMQAELGRETPMAAVVGEAGEPPAKVRPAGGFKVAIPADASGHYYANAIVNGRSLRVVVDTGATAIALTEETARRLGLRLDPKTFTAPVSTANGVAMAARVLLGEVRIGAISVRDVEALVIPGDALDVNLLGMSFLNKVRKFEVGGGQLVLTN